MEAVAARLLRYAADLEGSVSASDGTKWTALVQELKNITPSPERSEVTAASSAHDHILDLDAKMLSLQKGIELFLDPKWLENLETHKSYSFMQEMQMARKATLALFEKVRQKTAADVERVVLQLGSRAQPDVLLDFERLGVATLRKSPDSPLLTNALLFLLASDFAAYPLSSREALVETLQGLTLAPWVVEQQPEAGQSPACHPFEKQRLTFGAFPSPACVVGDKELYDVSMPGSRVVHYDLLALLKGVGGTTTSGLSYNLVKELDTIRYSEQEGGPAAAPREECAFQRVDAKGASPRGMMSAQDLSLQQILHGPGDDLDAYHRLAEATLEAESEGFLLSDPEGLLETFAVEIDIDSAPEYPLAQIEIQRRGTESSKVQKLFAAQAKRDQAEEEGGAGDLPSREAASNLMTSRLREIEKKLSLKVGKAQLKGSDGSRDREVALSVFLQGASLEEQFAKIRKLAPPGETWRAGSHSCDLLEQRLANEASSLATLKLATFWLGK